MFRLKDKMNNGATVADWLGTASGETGVAKMAIDRLRIGQSPNAERDLDYAIEELEQALEELREVHRHVRGS